MPWKKINREDFSNIKVAKSFMNEAEKSILSASEGDTRSKSFSHEISFE